MIFILLLFLSFFLSLTKNEVYFEWYLWIINWMKAPSVYQRRTVSTGIYIYTHSDGDLRITNVKEKWQFSNTFSSEVRWLIRIGQTHMHYVVTLRTSDSSQSPNSMRHHIRIYSITYRKPVRSILNEGNWIFSLRFVLLISIVISGLWFFFERSRVSVKRSSFIMEWEFTSSGAHITHLCVHS